MVMGLCYCEIRTYYELLDLDVKLEGRLFKRLSNLVCEGGWGIYIHGDTAI